MNMSVASRKPILLSLPEITREDMDAVRATMEAGWVTQAGPHLQEFEQSMIRYLGSGHAVALGSGTAAIHLALLVVGVQPGDEVLCSTFSFVATANPIRYAGAIPVFIDSEEQTWNLDPELLEEYLVECRKRGKAFPRALILAHIYGQPAQMDKIVAICKEYGMALIEDAAEALGADYRGQKLGTFGEVAAFSFNGNKVITTGGGGMLVSPSSERAERARFLSAQAKDPEPQYHHSEVGYNYRMSSLCAGLGNAQMRRLDPIVKRKRELFDTYVQQLKKVSELKPMPTVEGAYESRWLSSFSFDPQKLGRTPEEIINRLQAKKIEARLLWLPLHKQPIYRDCRALDRGVAQRLREGGISLPSTVTMSEADLEYVIDHLIDILQS